MLVALKNNKPAINRTIIDSNLIQQSLIEVYVFLKALLRGQLKKKQVRHGYVLLCALLIPFLTACEARLDLQGIDETLSEPIRRTDQLMSIQELTDGSQLIVGNNGLLLTRDNGQADWHRDQLTSDGIFPNFIGSSICPDGTVILLAYENQVWLSNDIKSDWRSIALPTSEEVQAITCTPSGDIWVTGSFSTLLVSRDKARTWSETTMGEDSMLTAINFVSANKGFAVGEFGLVLKTQDGGDSWDYLDPVSEDFYPLSAHFYDDQTGWLGSLQGVIMHTSDGGTSWQRQTVASDVPIYNFIKNDSLYATGDRGTVLKLDGSEWVRVPTPDIPTYYRSGIVTKDDSLLIAGGWGVLLPLDLSGQN